MIDGDLTLLDRDKLEELRRGTILATPADVANRTAHVAGKFAGVAAANASIERHAAQARLRAAIDQWAAVQRVRGRDDPQSYRRFYLTTGVDVLSALALPRADMDSLASKVESWYAQ